MNQPNYYDFPNSESPIPLVKSPSVRAEKIYFQSEPFWVVKLLHNQEFHHLNEQEFTVFRLLDGNISYRQLQDEFNRAHSPYRINFRETTSLLTDLFQKSLLEPARGGVGLGMHVQAREKRRDELKKKLKSIFAIKWKGWDPEWFLNLTNPYVTWFFSRPVVILNLVMLMLTLCWMGIHYEEFFSRLPGLWSFLNPDNWISLGLAVVGGKFFHELGHAYTQKRFGGECHEIGVMIFFFMPTLYCNTSDSWLLKEKWPRMLIGLGGVYIELFIFTIAAICWWFSGSGEFQSFCMNVMFVTSVSAALTNGNPLLRYDGYFVLADWLEIPNLSQKANKEINRVFLRYGCGDHRQVDLWTTESNKRIYLCYGVAAFCFRVFLMITIFNFLISTFQVVGLAYLGVLIGLVSLGTVFLQPIKALYKHLKEPGNWQHMKRKNLLVVTAAFIGFLGVVFLLPLPHWIPAECSVSIEGESSVYALEEGRVAELFARPGDVVKMGDPILTLTNDTLEKSAIETANELEATEAAIKLKFRDPSRQLDPSSEDDLSLVALRNKQKMLKKKCKIVNGQVDNLTIRAPCDGMIIGVASGQKQAETRAKTLNGLTGNPLNPSNLSAHVKKDTKICIIAPANSNELTLAFEQHYSSLVKVGQPTKILIDSSPVRLHGELLTVSLNESQVDEIPDPIADASTAAAVHHAKQLASPEAKKNIAYKDGQVSLSTLIQAKSSTGQSRVTLLYGSKGKAFIRVGNHTIAQKIWRSAARVFQANL